jgi:hypothetical protein
MQVTTNDSTSCQATGWFKIKQYDDMKSITLANIVEQEWLTHYL